MNKIVIAYIFSVLFIVVTAAIELVFKIQGPLVSLLYAAIYLIVVGKLISADAQERSIEGKVGFCSFFGIYGLFIYQVFIAKVRSAKAIILPLILVILLTLPFVFSVIPKDTQVDMLIPFFGGEEACDAVYPIELFGRNSMQSLLLNAECQREHGVLSQSTNSTS